MTEQLRITPAEVIAAYEKTGLMPHRGVFQTTRYRGEDGAPFSCGCPITVLYMVETNTSEIQLMTLGADTHPRNWANRKYGSSYTTQFICGFDRPEEEYQEVWQTGCRDGQEVFQSVQARFDRVYSF